MSPDPTQLKEMTGPSVAQQFAAAVEQFAQAEATAGRIAQLVEQREKLRQRELHRAYFAGIREGLTRYAHWKDGQQYVGSCGKTLEKALAEVNEEEKAKQEASA